MSLGVSVVLGEVLSEYRLPLLNEVSDLLEFLHCIVIFEILLCYCANQILNNNSSAIVFYILLL